MKLPDDVLKYEQTYQDLMLFFSKQTIRVRKYTTKEVRQYLNATATTDSEWVRNSETFKLFKTCVHPDDQDVIETICKGDFVHAISYLRSISYDPTIDRAHNCPNCGWSLDAYQLHILQNIKFDPEVPEIRSEFIMEDGNKIIFKPIPYRIELDIIKNKSEMDFVEIAHELLYNSVDTMVISGVVYECIDIDSIKEYIDNKLSISDYTKMLDFVTGKKLIFYIQEDLVCPNCNHEYVIRVDEPYFFVQV